MSLAYLKASRAAWVRREKYRKRKHTYAVNHYDKAGVKKWGKLLKEARAKIAKRDKQIAAKSGSVAAPCRPILQHSWGYHPGVHDGIDLITTEDDVMYALCDGVIFDVRSSGWWGKGARASGGHSIADGDGIIQLRCTVNVGPFKKGMHFGYGHAEKATVRVGQKVKAGQAIGHAGFANAWHSHFFCNGGQTTKGIGDRDPWPYVAFAIKHERKR